MAYEQRDNSGSLFLNDRRTSDKAPNAKGKAMIGGVMYYVSAWTKEGQKGRWQSLSFEPVEEAQARQQQRAGENGQRQQAAAPPQQQRRQQQPVAAPFAEEKQFEEADIPF